MATQYQNCLLHIKTQQWPKAMSGGDICFNHPTSSIKKRDDDKEGILKECCSNNIGPH